MIVLDNINIYLIFQFNFSKFFSLVNIYMASLASSNVNHTPIVEVYCTEQMLQLLGWTPDDLNSIRNVLTFQSDK